MCRSQGRVSHKHIIAAGRTVQILGSERARLWGPDQSHRLAWELLTDDTSCAVSERDDELTGKGTTNYFAAVDLRL